MPRIARRKSNTGIYHIILRGINKQSLFLDQEDKDRFLNTLLELKEKSLYKIYAYCLMDNHIHILIHEGNEGLAITMRRIGASFVYWYNHKYDRVGHLFQDRYISEPVEDDRYLLAVTRYIHQNPSRAGMVKGVEEYKWSSFREYVGESFLVDSEAILKMYNNNMDKAIIEFIEYHKVDGSEECIDIYDTRKIKDCEAMFIIKSICNVEKATDIQNFDKVVRDNYIVQLKNRGLSTRQISRLTGIGRSIVMKTYKT